MARDRLLGSQATAEAADTHLASDSHLGPLVAARPRLRVPGTVDGAELAIRAVLGQQISLAAARKLAGRLVAIAGERVEAAGSPAMPSAPRTDDGVEALDGRRPARPRSDEVEGAARPRSQADETPLTHTWPRPEAIVDAAGAMPMPRARQRALGALAAALAAGELRLEPGVDLDEARGRLLALPGIGPWTAEYVAMRALADPDAWLPTDVGVRRGLVRLGLGPEAAEAWRPFRAHAVAHLWAAG